MSIFSSKLKDLESLDDRREFEIDENRDTFLTTKEYNTLKEDLIKNHPDDILDEIEGRNELGIHRSQALDDLYKSIN